MRLLSSIKYCFLILLLLLGGLWFFWLPFSSNALEWVLAKQIKKQFNGHFHVEKITWEHGRVLLDFPSVTRPTPQTDQAEKQFFAERLVVLYEYSLWDRKIHFDFLFKDPHFKIDSTAPLLLMPLLNGKNTKLYSFNIDWKISIPRGNLIQSETKQFPFLLELTNAQNSISQFSLQMSVSPSEQLTGQIFSEKAGERTLHVNFNHIPLTELAEGLKFFEGPLNKLEIYSGFVEGYSKLRFTKKEIPSFEGELTFTDIHAKHPSYELKSTISKAVLSIPRDWEKKGKLELQDNCSLDVGSLYKIHNLQGSIAFENAHNAFISLHGKWLNGNESPLFSMQGRISPIISGGSPLKLNLAVKELEASLRDSKGNHFSTFFSGNSLTDSVNELHFSGSSELAAKLYPANLNPSAFTSMVQKQLDLKNIMLDGQIKKIGSKCTVDTTITFNDPSEPKQQAFMLGFDLKNLEKFAKMKIEVFPFEAYCCDLYLAGNIGVKSSADGQLGVSLIAETFNGQVTNLQHFLSHFERFNAFTRFPLQGNLSLAKGKNCFECLFTPEGFTFNPSFSGSLSEGKLNNSGQDLTFDDVAFDFSYDHAVKSLNFENFQGAFFIGAADNAEEYALAGHSINIHDLKKLHGTFDVALSGKENNLIRLAGHTTSESEQDPLSVSFDKERSHINGMSLVRGELKLNDAFHIEHFHLDFPLQLQKLIASAKVLSKTKIWRDSGLSNIKWESLEKCKGTLQAEMKYEQKSDTFLFNLQGADLDINSHIITSCVLNGKKRGNVWSIEQLQLDKLSIATDLIKENQKWIFKSRTTLGQFRSCGLKG